MLANEELRVVKENTNWAAGIYPCRLAGRYYNCHEQFGWHCARVPGLVHAGDWFLKGLSRGEHFRTAAGMIFSDSPTLDDGICTTRMIVPGNCVTGLHRNLGHGHVGRTFEGL